MKRLYLTLLIIISIGYCTSANSQVVRKACCPSGTDEKTCCEGLAYWNVWCPTKRVCVDEDIGCSGICDVGQPATGLCICTGMTLDVSPSNHPESAMPYCCRASDKNKRDCCTAMGFTWTGPNKNSGNCVSEAADLCIDMYQSDAPNEILH